MQIVIKIGVSLLLIVHGFVHLLGGFSELRVSDFNNLSGKLLFRIPSSLRKIFASLWLTATVLFVASGVALIASQAWWSSAAIASVVISQILIIIWWPDAKWGTVPNILVVLGLLFLK